MIGRGACCFVVLLGCGRSGLAVRGSANRGDAGPAGSDAGVDPDAGCADGDGDGFLALACGGEDCDDGSAAIHPGALERAAAWAIEDIQETEALSGDRTWLVLDPEGKPHVVYGQTQYWSRGESGWTVEALPMLVAAIAIDETGSRHVLTTSATLEYWTDASGDWVSETIADEASSATIAACPDGTIRAAWNGPAFVHYAARAEGAWTSETISGPYVGPASSIEITCDAASVPHVVYDHNALHVATRDTEAWTREIVAAVVRTEPRIDVSPSGKASVLYQRDVEYESQVTLATRNETGWASSILSREGNGGDLAFDSDDFFHVAYSDWLGEVHHVTGRSDGKTDEIVESTDQASATEIEIDGQGGLHVVYGRVIRPEYALRYAYRPPGDGVDQDCDGED